MKKTPEEIHKIAEEYVGKQLTILDGSAEAAIRRIGTERYEKLVRDIEKHFLEINKDS